METIPLQKTLIESLWREINIARNRATAARQEATFAEQKATAARQEAAFAEESLNVLIYQMKHAGVAPQ